MPCHKIRAWGYAWQEEALRSRDRIEELEAENARLRAENERLVERIARLIKPFQKRRAA